MRKRIIMMMAALAVSIAVANAAVFVYYPVGVTAIPQKPDVVFAPGTNAGNTDLGGNTITVNIGVNATNATIVVHPTLEYTYYYDILVVKNNGTQAYYVNFYVSDANYTAAGFTNAYLVVDGVKYPIVAGQLVLANNLQLAAGANITIGILFYAPDDAKFNGNAAISLNLVYSPVNETAPNLP